MSSAPYTITIIPSRPEASDDRNETSQRDRASPDENVAFTWWDMFFGVLGIVTYFVDMGTDCFVAADYLQSGQRQLAGATFAIVVFSCLVGTIMANFTWYRESADKAEFQKPLGDTGIVWEDLEPVIRKTSLMGFPRALSTLFLSSPVIKMIECLLVGRALMKSTDARDRRVLQELLMRRQDSASGLRMLEGIFEAIPQLHLQLYAWLTLDLTWNPATGALRGVSTLISWFSISWSLTAWYVAKRRLDWGKASSTRHKILHFLYRFAEMGGRTIATAAFASRFGVSWTLIPMAAYFARGLIMSMWAAGAGDSERKPLMTLIMFFFSYILRKSGIQTDACSIVCSVINEFMNMCVVCIMINLWYHLPMSDGAEWRFQAHTAAYALCMSCCFLPVFIGCFSCRCNKDSEI